MQYIPKMSSTEYIAILEQRYDISIRPYVDRSGWWLRAYSSNGDPIPLYDEVYEDVPVAAIDSEEDKLHALQELEEMLCRRLHVSTSAVV